MTKKSTHIGIVIVAVLIFFAGSCSGRLSANMEPTEAETVTETRTVYVESDPEVITRTVTEDLPESCYEMIQAAADLVEAESQITSSAGGILLAAQDAEKFSVSRNLEGMTDAIQRIRDERRAMNEAISEHGTITTQIETSKSLCESKSGRTF